MNIGRAGRKIRVLIVDDSSFMRMALRSVIDRDPSMEVAGIAVDGSDGVKKAAELRPDVVTMDVEMPKMDGIAALKEIMSKCPTRVIMVSTLTNEGARSTFDALEAGAVDYIAKNIRESKDSQNLFKEELVRKVKGAVGAPVARKAASAAPPTHPAQGHTLKLPSRVQALGIGASTGGPIALQEVLSRVPANIPFGIMVAIHMPKAFTGPYAERINSKCSISVKEAVDGDVLRPGTALIAPGGIHTTLVRQHGALTVKTSPTTDHPKYVYIPSVDLMLSSLADATSGSTVGVILTGMGNDGFKGMKYLKSKGGATLVQDEATSTIYGMPRACIEGGVADVVLPLGQIGTEIARIAEGLRRS